ncbi:glycosyltransferase [Paucihalobacter ruber]|uniref:Glycosyltransferase n=1 Tax=Paucihalobacter ruber TaxID=2567861 RepID=A0A506PJS0_9FLAO|nr:glycosyltransferase [Paucihalobacter ruber]TPV33367.1 glycosyltransferase [Paucihalobacter ruber]
MESNKINIAFILPNLLPGGAERVISFIAQNLNPKKFNSTLIIMGFSKDASYDIRNINVVFFEKQRVSKGAFSLVKFLKKNKLDIVVSANDHLNTLIAYVSLLFPTVKFISREVTIQSSMVEMFSQRKHSFNLLSYLSRNRYNYFDKIICQSQDMLQDLKKRNNIKNDKLIVINNPISNNFKVKNKHQDNEIKQFVTVGRLSKEKGHARLLSVLSKINYPFHYTIIGDGPEKENIYNLTLKHGLSSKITHVNFTNEVHKYLAKSDLFLQGSFYEGFPNSLMESCAVGTPVLAFNVPGGTKEIIKNGINGYMVDSEEDFLEKMNNLKHWNSIDVSKSVTERFNKSRIIEEYEDLFKNILKQTQK